MNLLRIVLDRELPKELRPTFGYSLLAEREDKSTDDKTRALDASCEAEGLRQLALLLPERGIPVFVVVTEELGVLLYGCSPKQLEEADTVCIVFLDPVDNTHQALLGFGGCSVTLLTEAAVTRDEGRASLADPEILAAVVATPGGETFWAEKGRDGAYVGDDEKLTPGEPVEIEAAILSAVVYKAERIKEFYRSLDWVEGLLPATRLLITGPNLGRVGPRPLAMRDKISPAVAGLATLTSKERFSASELEHKLAGVFSDSEIRHGLSGIVGHYWATPRISALRSWKSFVTKSWSHANAPQPL